VLQTLFLIIGLTNFNSNIWLHQKLGLLNSQLEKFLFSRTLSEIHIVSVSIAFAYDCCRCQTSFRYLSFTVCTSDFIDDSGILSIASGLTGCSMSEKLYGFLFDSNKRMFIKTLWSTCIAYALWGQMG
jgi:hypothetical protein